MAWWLHQHCSLLGCAGVVEAQRTERGFIPSAIYITTANVALSVNSEPILLVHVHMSDLLSWKFYFIYQPYFIQITLAQQQFRKFSFPIKQSTQSESNFHTLLTVNQENWQNWKGAVKKKPLIFFLDRITLEVRLTCKWVLSCCHWALLIQWYSDVGRTTTETFLAYQVYYVLPLRHVSIESIVMVPASQISDSLG